MNQEKKCVYILSPVRQATSKQSAMIAQHVQKIVADGDQVFNPIEHAPQQDPTGYNIVMTELAALHDAAKRGGRVDILWNVGGTPSEGSRVDVGMAIALGLEYQLITSFNQECPTGPQIAYQIILRVSRQLDILHAMLEEIRQSNEIVIDWDIEMITEEQEWQRIRLGLVLGCFAQNPNLKIRLGKLRGEDPPNKKSYPKVMQEIEKRQRK